MLSVCVLDVVNNKFDLAYNKLTSFQCFIKNAFWSLYDNVFIMSNVNTVFTLIINILMNFNAS